MIIPKMTIIADNNIPNIKNPKNSVLLEEVAHASFSSEFDQKAKFVNFSSKFEV